MRPVPWTILTFFALSTEVESQDLLVTSRSRDAVVAYDGSSARLFAASPELAGPVGLTFGPDGHLYVAAGDSNRILRYDGGTGAPIDVFIEDPRLESPGNIAFGPHGGLYVADAVRNQILRYDLETRAFDRVAAEGQGLDGPVSFTFGPDDDLYVGSVQTHQILRYDGETGQPLGVFASTALAGPQDVNFGPDGHLYVSDAFTGLLLRFHGERGELLDVFVDDPALVSPLGFTWGRDGRLYVAEPEGNRVRRYDGLTGAFVDVYIAGEMLASASFLAFEAVRDGVHLDRIEDATGTGKFVVTGSTPGGRVAMVFGTPDGETSIRECDDLYLEEISAVKAVIRVADESGAVVVFGIPPEIGSGEVLLQSVDLMTCRVSNVLELVLR
ncbi:MAG TPA: NHL repeat-containing protein [Vicinamibacteria bacterium]|nr:NHL repeat-containing protein [Vicinamibacteria bacterium]